MTRRSPSRLRRRGGTSCNHSVVLTSIGGSTAAPALTPTRLYVHTFYSQRASAGAASQPGTGRSRRKPAMLTASDTHKSRRCDVTPVATDVRPSFLATSFGCLFFSYSSGMGEMWVSVGSHSANVTAGCGALLQSFNRTMSAEFGLNFSRAGATFTELVLLTQKKPTRTYEAAKHTFLWQS